ncbi:hypothetical protein CsSME_00016723 [Camellia sinensis var. sinensis]
MVALATNKEVEQRKVEVEAELEATKADQAKLIEEAIQKGWDEAEADYAQQVLELRDGLFAKGWTEAHRAVGTEETSALFKDILVPSKTVIARAAKANETLVAETSKATLYISLFVCRALFLNEQNNDTPPNEPFHVSFIYAC